MSQYVSAKVSSIAKTLDQSYRLSIEQLAVGLS